MAEGGILTKSHWGLERNPPAGRVWPMHLLMLCAANDRTVGKQQPASTAERLRTLAGLLALLLLTLGVTPQASQAAETTAVALAMATAQPLPAATGPTIRLDYDPGKSDRNPIASFMYFVPLISLEPVTCSTSPGSTQSAQVTSAKRRFTAHSFLTTCEFEFSGTGSQQSRFDFTNQIRRQEQRLKEGGSLRRQLSSITVEGTGSGTVEVEGTVSNGVQTVTEVRLRFNARGATSPVSIGLCDIRYVDGEYQQLKEMVARVNTLTFCRKPGPPKMEVTVDSVKKKGAGNSLWQSIKGGITGVAVNLFSDPLTVEATGNQAMLDFGQALVSGAPTFTFPYARNLKQVVAAQP
jgi:hypothetical protein